MVLKTIQFPTEDLILQSDYLKNKVTALCKLPSSAVRESIGDRLEEILRYAHYHIQCVASYQDLMGISSTLSYENHTEGLASLLLSVEDESISVAHLQVEIMQWYSVVSKSLSF